jgi:hypothetical protein
MAAVKTKRISTLIESQLPEFITTEYELFSKFVQKYYEQQEVQGGTLDIINNIQTYADIDYYEKNLLKQNDTLASSISSTDNTITLSDAQSFPAKNGYVRINDEIIFYETRTDTQLQNCSRGVSGNTTLGDLYDASEFVSTDAKEHVSGATVYNISNLFLYALVKNFESQYLGSFPEKYLKGDVDKRTLIKNIKKFYKSKGTTSSIKFVFNTIIAKDIENKPKVYNPKDFTYKSSESDWVNIFALKVKVISGNPKDLIGKTIIQEATEEYGYASALVDNVISQGILSGESIWSIVVAPETVNGKFEVSTKTRLEKTFASSDGPGSLINVFSTIGWESAGEILVDDEVIEFDSKSITQFKIKNRGETPTNHTQDTLVYKPIIIKSSNIKLLSLGVVYNATIETSSPYSSVGDSVEISNPGFESKDPKIIDIETNQTRWILSSGQSVSSLTNLNKQTELAGITTNVSAIFADEQYYYITSSSYPSYNIFNGSTITETLEDQKLLRIIRKESTPTTEIYKTPRRDVGILVNGVRLYGYKDTESIRFGKLQSIRVDNRGRGYVNPPFVLIDGTPNKARAFLTGEVLDSIEITSSNTYLSTPSIEITSGRDAIAKAIVTGGEITSIAVVDSGKYYSSPPTVRITDTSGRGRFAEFNAILNTDGTIKEYVKLSGGSLYTQANVKVDIISVGSSASATPLLKEWIRNRYAKLESSFDTEYGYVFENYDRSNFGYGYGQIANPKSLRIQLQDNLNSANTEPSEKTHSPILGFAYDGNPIYGPFGYSSATDANSAISRMQSSYRLKSSRIDGPPTSRNPLGSYTDDFEYLNKSGSLDENNGRFCITPEYPDGVYAYFITINDQQVPQFPYIIGDKFYSLPVDSNYNSNINQNDIPKNSKRYSVANIPVNGEGLIAKIGEVKSGNVDRISIESSSSNFTVDSKVFFDNTGTEGKDVEALVSRVNGKSVTYLESKEDRVVKLTTIQSAYLFADDVLRQPASGASGSIVGTVANDNIVVLRNVIGTFNNTGTFSADIKTFILTVDQDSNYTRGATLLLTDGVNPAIATAEILENTSRQNTLRIKVLSGTWIIDEDYFIQSDNLFNTSGSRIVSLVSLSDNLEPFEVNQSVALIETSSDHGLGIGDSVDINIFPDDTAKTKTYYIRKRLYQEVVLRDPSESSTLDFDGIGVFTLLNGGADYTTGTYTDIPITGGSGSGATANITVSTVGVISSFQISNGGSGYNRGDYLGVDDDQLARSGASLSSSRLSVYVDHAGTASFSTVIKFKSALGFVNGDFVSIGSEIMEISSISGNDVTVIRGREGTTAVNHYDKQSISLFKPRYNFTPNFVISTSAGAGRVSSYDLNTQKATIIFDYSINLANASTLQNGVTFFDASSTPRLVTVNSSSETKFKFEFSEDNTTFTPNPNINIQEYYKYVFDTSHPSLLQTYFDLSPSRSFNLLTLEKEESSILPGNVGSFTNVKFGFGSRLAQNNFQEKVKTNFTNFYYFDKNGIVDSEGKFLKIITDPLQGTKTINYVTPNRFVYDITSTPLWDGSGIITYTTTGKFAIGSIENIKIVNLGDNYKKLPIITGVNPANDFKADATVLYDTDANIISGVKINNNGSNYIKPKVSITDGDGVGATFKILQNQGKIDTIVVDNPGKGYTKAPVIEIIETDVKLFAESDRIGVPLTISIINNGGGYYVDETVSSNYTSNYTLQLKSTGTEFEYKRGERVTQTVNNVEVFSAEVSEYRKDSNLLKVKKVNGIVRENVSILGNISRSTAKVKKIFVSILKVDISSYYDNLGFYTSDKGKLGVSNQKITDSFFYQDYSYVIQSKTSIEQWRDLIKSTTHPAGFKLFGQVDIDTIGSNEMPVASRKADTFSIIQLWDPEKNNITVESTKQITTQTIQTVRTNSLVEGSGSAATSEYNFNQTRAFNFTLLPAFDGTFNSDGQLVGTTSFQVKDPQNNSFSPVSAESLIITLDGILQEPGVSYTVSGDRIIFSQPPLGAGAKLTGQSLTATSAFEGSRFVGRAYYFTDAQYNTRYIRKLRNIFQRNGIWIDAANQIDRNKQFIIEESVGYGQEKYPELDWSTKLDDYSIDIGYILEAYEHDLRFGGNIKVFDYSTLFANNSAYITENKTESLAIFKYATNLANLSIRNWDYTDNLVSYILGSKIVNVTNTDNLAVGMFISSGKSFSSDTKIVSIDSLTQVTLNKIALANAGGVVGASAGITNVSGTTTDNVTLETSTLAVNLGETYTVSDGDIINVPLSISGNGVATFSFSAVNNGTFYDASNLINANKAYLQEEISQLVYATYPSLSTSVSKCSRDLGFLIDNIVYHLKFGGNEKVVEFAQLYYTRKPYPIGEELAYLNRTPDETAAAILAWDKVAELAILAMRQTLPAGTYTSITPVTDPDIITDSETPICAEVSSAINSYITIVKDIIEDGPGTIDPTKQNENKSGNWTNKLTYSNYNILPDPLLPEEECTTVISSVNSLYSLLDDILNDIESDKTLPDYVDGENKEFEMYWSNGDQVVLEKYENILLTLNAVLQETKFTAEFPGDDAYYIDKTVVPNKLIFDVAPIWDQDSGARSLGEPTAVERVVGRGVGNYKRLTIQRDFINNVTKGPFLILDLEDNTVANIEEPDYLLVFIDSVLQKPEDSYEISGPNITFKFPVTEQMKIDFRYLYGRDIGQILTIYNYNKNIYGAKSVVSLEANSNIDEFFTFSWMNERVGNPIQAYQINDDGSLNIIGDCSNFSNINGTVNFDVFGIECELIQGRDVYFCIKGRYFKPERIIMGIDSSGNTITYNVDEVGRNLLETKSQSSSSNPFISLRSNSRIKIEGEDNFRKIKMLPTQVTSTEGRKQQQLSNSFYGEVDVSSYNGITRGEGLSVVATIENGSVVDLTWNQRSYDPITQPTAYQYYTTPVLNFIPKDGNGGGARARVLVNNGDVISVDLIDGGSGYTQTPKVVVARKYAIEKGPDGGGIGLNELIFDITSRIFLDVSVISNVSVVGSQIPGINSFTSILFDSPVASDRQIENIITPKLLEVSEDLNAQLDVGNVIIELDLQNVDTQFKETTVTNIISTPYIVDIESSSTLIASATREITSSVNNVINNTALSNINYYATGAFLDLPLTATDNIVYITDTSKFSSYGYLLIGTEVVRYYRKMNDRFLMVQRGENNTTAQSWNAGIFIRQIPDPTVSLSVGVTIVESDSLLVTMPAASQLGKKETKTSIQVITPITTINQTNIDIVIGSNIEINTEISSITLETVKVIQIHLYDIVSVSQLATNTEVLNNVQISTPTQTITKNQFELLRIPPPSGVIDRYQESVFITDPISTRSGLVDILEVSSNVYEVITRSGDSIIIGNKSSTQNEYQGNYSISNAGYTIGSFQSSFDSGTANVSGITLIEFAMMYSDMTIRDFEERSNSSFTLSGRIFNLIPPSIQNPVATTTSSGTIPTTIVVLNTTYFPDSGYLFTSSGSVIQYTGKTSTEFTGCTLFRGPNSITSGDELIPFTVY